MDIGQTSEKSIFPLDVFSRRIHLKEFRFLSFDKDRNDQRSQVCEWQINPAGLWLLRLWGRVVTGQDWLSFPHKLGICLKLKMRGIDKLASQKTNTLFHYWPSMPPYSRCERVLQPPNMSGYITIQLVHLECLNMVVIDVLLLNVEGSF